nr:hypothetical protein Iba_chr12aCG7540 [Ipomoea batatas]
MLSNSFVILVRRGVRNETERKGVAVRAASVLHSLAKALGYGEMRPGLGLGCSLWIWLITLLEKEILEERIGGQRIREKMLGKELGRIRKNTGFGFWEEEWFGGLPGFGWRRRRYKDYKKRTKEGVKSEKGIKFGVIRCKGKVRKDGWVVRQHDATLGQIVDCQAWGEIMAINDPTNCYKLLLSMRRPRGGGGIFSPCLGSKDVGLYCLKQP